MDDLFLKKLIQPADTKIVMLVMDGLGGLPRQPGGKTELETAHTPHMDALAALSSLGLTIPVAPGITTGSGPGHLALFGYDPLHYEIGRGVMEALGVDFELKPEDLAARGNFCTIDDNGLVSDRRAGRIPTGLNQQLSRLLASISLDEGRVYILPVKEHRFAFVLRAAGLSTSLCDTDPQKTGVPPLPVTANDPGSAKAARLVNQFLGSAQKALAKHHPANMIMLRGFARLPNIPSFPERYGLNAAAVAVNGMYRGVARMVKMQVLEVHGVTLEDELVALEKNWPVFNFFYLHIKKTDTLGEQGDFNGKVAAIEEVDAALPRIMALNPQVLIITGDHSSPAVLKAHSWHPVPLLLYSHLVRPDGISEFGERACVRGSLGTIPAIHIMPLALANASRLSKYGA